MVGRSGFNEDAFVESGWAKLLAAKRTPASGIPVPRETLELTYCWHGLQSGVAPILVARKVCSELTM